MPSYSVTWSIDVVADGPRAAAEQAERIMRRPVEPSDSYQARVYEVSYRGSRLDDSITIDLAENDE